MAVTGSSFCEDHQPAPRDQRFGYRAFYSDPEYKRNRLERLRRARYRCERCGRPVKKGEWECDHIIEVAEWCMKGLPGSPNQIENLQILCKVEPNRCHYAKTASRRRR